MHPRLKFNLVMLVAFGIGLAAVGFVADVVLKDNAREEVIQKARIMRASAM